MLGEHYSAYHTSAVFPVPRRLSQHLAQSRTLRSLANTPLSPDSGGEGGVFGVSGNVVGLWGMSVI